MVCAKILKIHIWFINVIYKTKGISLIDINKLWDKSEFGKGQPLPRTTFNRYRDEIEEIWGIKIGCARKNGNRYFIENPEILEGDTFQKLIFTTVSVCNTILKNTALLDRIILDNVPSHDDRFDIVVEAMKQGKRISFKYCKYDDSALSTVEVSPYSLKLWNQRWYLLGRHLNGGFCIYSLDGILEMTITDNTFYFDTSFNARAFFSECFGVQSGDGCTVEYIRLRAYGNYADYLKDMPIHCSQKVLASSEDDVECEKYTDFEYMLRPTSDFKDYLMGRGAQVKVLSPKWLAEEIRQLHLDAAAKE